MFRKDHSVMGSIFRACFVFFLVGQLSGQAQMVSEPLEPMECPATFLDAHSALSFPTPQARVATTSTFEVSYENVPTQAQEAFAYAVSIWSRILVSAVPIRIKVTFSALASTTLASSGATRIFRDFPNAPFRSVWYPVALAESIRGGELNNRETDINITINQAIRWNFQTDAQPVSGSFDFVTVVLHEIAHGLGFISSFKTNATNAAQGEYGQSGFPFIFDLFIQNTSGQTLSDTGLFGNPSTSLFGQLTGGQLQFSLMGARRISPLPRLFAPNPFASGNSISHLNESSYPIGNTNSLMTPNVRTAEVIHQPGDLTRRILNQIGWGVANLVDGLVTQLEPAEPELTIFPNPASDHLYVHVPSSWSNSLIHVRIHNLAGQEVFSSIFTPGNDPLYLPLTKIKAGTYLISFANGKVNPSSKRLVVWPATNR